MNETSPVKNAAAVALGKLNAGKPRRQSPELRAKRVELAAHARACKLAKKRMQVHGLEISKSVDHEPGCDCSHCRPWTT